MAIEIKKTVVFIYGTRPEFIKLVPVIKEFKKDKSLNTVLVCTGQHGEMLDSMHKLFKIWPNYNFEAYKEKLPLNILFSFCFNNIENDLRQYYYPIVIVHGDTETALAGALAAFNNGFTVCHIESGLRSYDNKNPFPEEMNRCLIDKLSTLKFCTDLGYENLLDEGINKGVFVTGNTIIDAVKSIKIPRTKRSTKKKILVTCHRRERLVSKKAVIRSALERLSKTKNVEIQYLTHPNFKNEKFCQKNIKLIDPIAYDKFLKMIKESYFVLTDSGGLQEECAILHKPCLVIRDATERQESIDLGISKLIGSDSDIIYNECLKLIENKNHYKSMIKKESEFIYGIPGCGKRIYNIIKKELL